MRLLRYVLIGAAAMLGACRTVPEPPQYAPRAIQAPSGPYIHFGSGMVFPVEVGPFTRAGVTRYAENGSNESVGYNFTAGPGAEIAATFYVYPPPPLTSIGSPPEVIAEAQAYLCASDFGQARVEIERAHPRARLLSSGEAVLPNAGKTHHGYQAHYNFTSARFATRQAVPVRSELYVFCASERWLVKYRFTYPADYDASPRIAAFMRDLRWTIPSALHGAVTAF